MSQNHFCYPIIILMNHLIILMKNLEVKKKRVGKDSNILTIVRKLLSEPENWMKVESKRSYHFPGVLLKLLLQQLSYTEDMLSLQQSCKDPHFLWRDIQLSKGQLNKDRLIKIEIWEVYYRSAPCLGVKYCPKDKCTHIVPICDKRNCPKHNIPLQKKQVLSCIFIQRSVQMVDAGLVELFNAKSHHLKTYIITRFMLPTKYLNLSKKRSVMQFHLIQHLHYLI